MKRLDSLLMLAARWTGGRAERADAPRGCTARRRPPLFAHFALAMLSMLVAADAEGYSVSMTLSHPRETTTVARRSDGSYGYGDATKESSSHYSGTIDCPNLGKDESAVVTIEAFFVTRKLNKNAKEIISGEMEVGVFEFGGDTRHKQKFEFDSPKVLVTKHESSYSGYRRVGRDGVKYLGAIVRAVVDGKVVKVLSMPSNRSWNELAMRKDVIFDGQTEPVPVVVNPCAKKVAKSAHAAASHGVNGGANGGARADRAASTTPPGWMDDFFAAQSLAKKSGKSMVVVLTFADWHSHSDMEKKVIRSASFYRAAKENYVLVYIDRNSKGAKRDEVEQLLGVQGNAFDFLIVDSNGVKAVELGDASQLEEGADGYLDYFARVDKALRSMAAVKDDFAARGIPIDDPQCQVAMEQCYRQMDEDLQLGPFKGKIENMLRGNQPFRRHYPYFQFVQPLEEELQTLTQRLDEETRISMNREKGSWTNYSAAHRKHKGIAFADGGYSRKLSELLAKADVAERSLPTESAASRRRLRSLRMKILASINENGGSVVPVAVQQPQGRRAG